MKWNITKNKHNLQISYLLSIGNKKRDHVFLYDVKLGNSMLIQHLPFSFFSETLMMVVDENNKKVKCSSYPMRSLILCFCLKTMCYPLSKLSVVRLNGTLQYPQTLFSKHISTLTQTSELSRYKRMLGWQTNYTGFDRNFSIFRKRKKKEKLVYYTHFV